MKASGERKKRRFFSLPDIFVLGFALLCTALGFVFLLMPKGEGELFAEIKIHGELFKTVELTSVENPYEIPVEGDLPVTIEVAPEGIRFKESKCPDKLCINRGAINKSGESAVCLPAAVSIRIVSKNSSPQVDAVMG